MRTLKTIGGVRGEIVLQDDEKTVLRLPVTRFGGPETKDLHGEYFAPDCYFGDDTVTTKFALYEHLMNPMSNPHAPEGVKAQVLGKAVLAKTDDMARWFDFEIRRANQYHDYILKLNELGYLGTSTQCFPGGKTVDGDGRITDWLEGEVTLTPTPADHLSVPKVVEVAKSFGLPEPVLAEDAAEGTSEEAPAPAEDAVAETPVEQGEEEVDLEAAMEAILNQTAETPAGQPPALEVSELVEQVKAMRLQVEAANVELASIKAWVFGDDATEGASLMETLKAIQQAISSADAEVKKLQKAQLTFADHVVKSLKREVRDIAQESPDEREAEEIVAQYQKQRPAIRRRSPIPDHAPGGG